MFKCNILQENVSIDKIEKWEKRLRTTILNGLQKKMLKRYEIETIEEYIKLIKDNINNEDILDNINRRYLINKSKEIEEENRIEDERIKRVMSESIRRSNSDVKIRMLGDKDEKRAVELYLEYKKYMGEETDNIILFVQDFIIKNIIFGIFENKTMAGIIILQYSRQFNIDNYEEKVNTFYIQELVIDEQFKGKGYGNLLINYAILRCPKDMDYIAYMTEPTNQQMRKIGEKYKFILQKTSSGDKKHTLLYIRVNDRIERSLYTNLSYKSGS